MARERVSAIVLCEDSKQRSFLQRLLERRIASLRFVIAPRGVNAEQWLRQQYPAQARAFRSEAPHQPNLVLVVTTDGDALGLGGRKATLDDSLRDEGYAAREHKERIAYLIPTWSIETWLVWLCGESSQLDGFAETKALKRDAAYAQLERRDLVSPKLAAAAWRTPRAGESIMVPSMTDARQELQRIPD